MSVQIHEPEDPVEAGERLEYARQIIRAEAAALEQLAGRLDASFPAAVDLIFRCSGRVCLTGTGKSADVAQKIAGTFNSTGTRTYTLDATRAVHGDLGMVAPNDVVLALSHSGESEEVVRLIGPLRQMASALVAVTGNRASSLAGGSDVALVYGPLSEACPLGLAPSTSTTVMIALGDALAFVLSRMRQFKVEDFARFHPAGSLGRQLMKVEAVMRRGDEVRLASCERAVRQVFTEGVKRRRRTGAVMLVDDEGRLRGLFTDSDLGRLLAERREDALDRPIREVMISNPITVPLGTRLMDALEVLCRHKISELPVIDGDGKPAGLVDITDVIGLVSAEPGAEATSRAA